MSAAAVVGLDPLRDVTHKGAVSARDQADWLAWLELGGTRPRTLSDYEWATARLLRALPLTAFPAFTASDIAHVLRSFPPAGRRTKAAYARGCRCEPCREAKREYELARKARAA